MVGANWTVQNDNAHNFTAQGVDEVVTLPNPVSSWDNAFIIGSLEVPAGNDGKSQLVWTYRPGAALDEVIVRLNSGLSGSVANYNAFITVVENPDMSVEHLNSITGGLAQLPSSVAPGPDLVSRAITPVSDAAQTSVFASIDSSGNVAQYPIPFWNYGLVGNNQVDFFRGTGGNEGDVALQIVQWPNFISGGLKPRLMCMGIGS